MGARGRASGRTTGVGALRCVPSRPGLSNYAPLLLLVAIVLLVGPPASSWELYRNEEHDLSIHLDSVLSFGVSLRTEDRDKDLIWIGHGGRNQNAASINNDDGNLNFDQWDVYSTLIKGTSELEVRWRNYAAFTRVTAFLDPIVNCTGHGSGAANLPGGLPNPAFDGPDCSRRSRLDGRARTRANRFEGGVVGGHFQLLDAFIEGSWDVFERPLDLRVGNQLISWGEGFFIQGINQINPVDVTKLRVPGSEIKEALLPSPMVRLQTEILPGLGIDAYYQFHWNPTNLDPTGSYFATSDLVGRGASLPADGSGQQQGLFLPNALPPTFDFLGPADPAGTGLSPEELFALGRGVPRTKTDEPTNQGQAGVALRYFFEQAQTQLGLYYVHYHSKTPVVGLNGTGFPLGPGISTNVPVSYFRQYPQHINLVGFSFATQVMSVALAGEVSYRPDDPVPISALTGDPLEVGTITRRGGFKNEHRLQFILNMLASITRGTRVIGPLVDWIGANDISFVAEWGLVFYPGLRDTCANTGNFGLFGPVGAGPIQSGCTAYAGPSAGGKNVDEVSWGYQFRIGPNYFNPFGLPIRFQPFFSWQHDVDGVTPGLNPFIQGRKGANIGAEIIYLDTWTGRISYANFFGGGRANLQNDRDFLSFSISYAY